MYGQPIIFRETTLQLCELTFSSECCWWMQNPLGKSFALTSILLVVQLSCGQSHPTRRSFLISHVAKRLQAVNRLFRIISDVTSPAFVVEGQQWHSSVIEIFYHYFSALWFDPSVRYLYNSSCRIISKVIQEEIRLAVQVSSAALLPAHFNIISQCWNETLLKSPVGERIRLLGFLIQLRSHFPSWRGGISISFCFMVPSYYIQSCPGKQYWMHSRNTKTQMDT